MNLHTAVCGQPGENQLKQVYAVLGDYNQQANPEFWAALDEPANGKQPLTLFTWHGEQIVGGLTATTQLSWLKIDILAVEKEYRRQGIGRQLMQLAEKTAAARGCKYALVYFIDYESTEFYTRCGYQTAGTIPDWDSHGNSKYYFTRRLS